MVLYKVSVQQYPDELLHRIKQNLEAANLKGYIKEYPDITIICAADGHEYYLKATSEKDALEKVFNNKLGLPCGEKEGK